MRVLNNSLKEGEYMTRNTMRYYLSDPFTAFDQIFDAVSGKTISNGKPGYPPYNTIRHSDDKVVMEFAIAGFRKEDIDIAVENNTLTIKGERPEDDPNVEYLHRGIAGRKFIRQFTLPKYFEVDRAGIDNGILYINLVRNIPDEEKPKKISIE